MTTFNINWTQTDATSGEVATIIGTLTTEIPVVVQPPPGDTTPPSAPTGLAATAVSATSAKLTWAAATDNVAVTGYKVSRGGTQIAVITATSYIDSGLVNGTAYSYTVTAIDAAGNTSPPSAALAFTLNWVVVPPQPTGGGQYPDLLKSYTKKPPFQVAGVDYPVGVPAGTTLKDPATISMSGVSINTSSRSVNINGNNITLDGYDFGLHNGYQLAVGGSNAVIKNCNFLLGTNTGNVLIWGGGGNLTIQNCTMDASGNNNQTSLIQYKGNGTISLLNNWFKNFPQHVVEFVHPAGNYPFQIVYKYNLIDNGGLKPGAHLNYLQFGGGACNLVDVQYNTGYQRKDVGGEGFQTYCNTSGGSINNVTIAFNVFQANQTNSNPDYKTISTLIHGPSADYKTPGSNLSCHDNYADWRGCWYYFYPNSMNGYAVANNYDMVTGKIIGVDNVR